MRQKEGSPSRCTFLGLPVTCKHRTIEYKVLFCQGQLNGDGSDVSISQGLFFRRLLLEKRRGRIRHPSRGQPWNCYLHGRSGMQQRRRRAVSRIGGDTTGALLAANGTTSRKIYGPSSALFHRKVPFLICNDSSREGEKRNSVEIGRGFLLPLGIKTQNFLEMHQKVACSSRRCFFPSDSTFKFGSVHTQTSSAPLAMSYSWFSLISSAFFSCSENRSLGTARGKNEEEGKGRNSFSGSAT